MKCLDINLYQTIKLKNRPHIGDGFILLAFKYRICYNKEKALMTPFGVLLLVIVAIAIIGWFFDKPPKDDDPVA